MSLLLIGKQKNGHYLVEDFATFWPMFTCFCEPWNSNFLWRIIMQAILHQSGQHSTQKVYKNAPKQYPLVRILLGLFIVPLLPLPSDFPMNPVSH